ncbi:MAG: hypothetical protein JWO46_2271 [Nocardioidaceae bacterium]|nr:hypothetical protein [Nocardioidaceae bacterium]
MSEPAFSDEARGPWSRWQGVAFDVSIVGALLLVVLVALIITGFGGSEPLVAAAFGVVQVLPLLVRRVQPVATLALVTVFSLLQLPFTSAPGWGQLAVPITVYSVATYGSRRAGRVALLLGLVGAVLGPMDWALGAGGFEALVAGGLLCALLVVTSWAVGMLGRTRQAYVEQLIDRGIRLEREAAQRAELAASDERARIAREMHDVVAHGLSVMVVQADGARYQLDRDPERVGRALETIAGTGRESLHEMRRMLGLLRADAEENGTRPQPGLADLPYLLDQDPGPGITVEADVADDLPQVGQGVGLAAYRIVQEALTNVRKHAGPGTHVTVSVHADHGRLAIAVDDDGRGASAPSDGAGHGITGMRERVIVHGGRLDAGPRPGGGFAVHASLPYDDHARGALGELLR